MNSAQIHYVLHSDPCTKPVFRGVFPSDMLKEKLRSIGKQRRMTDLKLPAAYVANTAPAAEPGTHWVAFWFSANTYEAPEYFDSYGRPPDRTLLTVAGAYGHKGKFARNDQTLQGRLTTVCGQYCLFFILLRSRGFTLQEIISMFNADSEGWNDSMVTSFVNKHFSINTDVLDYKYVLQRAWR